MSYERKGRWRSEGGDIGVVSPLSDTAVAGISRFSAFQMPALTTTDSVRDKHKGPCISFVKI